jgi:hypothetical protein
MEVRECLLSTVQNLLSSSLLPNSVKIKIQRIIILPLALYGCETWSLTLRDEDRLRVFVNRVMRRIFGPQRDDVTGEWRRLYQGALGSVLLNKYHSREQVKNTEIGRTCGTYGGEERRIQGLGGKT